MDAVFRALADPTRRRLLERLLAENGQTLGALCAHLDMTRQGVTQHLALLEDCGLVVTAWRGREKLHFLHSAPILALHAGWIRRFERDRPGPPVLGTRDLPGLAARLGEKVATGTRFHGARPLPPRGRK